jgi:hypothetical protein
MLQEDMKHDILNRVKSLGDAAETVEQQGVMN